MTAAPPARRVRRRLGTVAAGALALAGVGVPPAFAQTLGQAVFAHNCAACHQSTGKGVPGAFPALDGDAVVQGSPPALATVLIRGRGGMPSFRNDLSDDDIAAVLTYVRQAWSNRAAPVTAATVVAARGASAAATAPHTLQAH